MTTALVGCSRSDCGAPLRAASDATGKSSIMTDDTRWSDFFPRPYVATAVVTGGLLAIKIQVSKDTRAGLKAFFSPARWLVRHRLAIAPNSCTFGVVVLVFELASSPTSTRSFALGLSRWRLCCRVAQIYVARISLGGSPSNNVVNISIQAARRKKFFSNRRAHSALIRLTCQFAPS